MQDVMIIVTDLEHFKAFKMKKRRNSSKESLELLTSFDNIEPHKKISERMSDRAGRFRGHGTGESHRSTSEDRRRLTRYIADRVNSVLADNNVEAWYFAAPKKINNEILGNVKTDFMNKLRTTIQSDLTKSPEAKIVDLFIS
ncbi:MAG: host attachment protein [Spirochaetes bacterium]|nr:host attachment protein [Spirochaetota bacterium]